MLSLVAGCATEPELGTAAQPVLLTTVSAAQSLGGLGGPYAAALGVNEAGDAVGYATTAAGGRVGFVYRAATGMVPLASPLPGDPYPDDINNAGQIVGVVFGLTPNGAQKLDTVVWGADGAATVLSLPAGCASGSSGRALGRALNDLGQVVGEGRCGGSAFAFAWAGGAYLGQTPNAWNSIEGHGIDNLGRVVGTEATGPDTTRGFVWTPGGDKLAVANGQVTGAAAINDAGQVVGSTAVAGQDGAFAYSYTPAGGVRILTLGGASHVNDLGVVVGWRYDAATNTASGFAWSERGGLVPLPTPAGMFNCEPTEISNTGYIAGACSKLDGTGAGAYLWRLTTQEYTPTEALQQLANQVASSAAVLGAGRTKALTTKVSAASARLAVGDRAGAASMLTAFLNQVGAFARAGALDAAAADALAATAAAIQRELAGG